MGMFLNMQHGPGLRVATSVINLHDHRFKQDFDLHASTNEVHAIPGHLYWDFAAYM